MIECKNKDTIMLYQKSLNDKTAFWETNFTFDGKWQKLQRRSESEIASKRKFFCFVRRKFIRKCAQNGLLNHIFTKEQIKKALKGNLPDNYDVHHILPISLGGQNRPNNLCIIHKMVHNALHQRYWDIIRDNWDTQKNPLAYVFVPTNLKIISDQGASLFFSSADIFKIKKEYKKRLKISAFHAKQKAALQQKTKNHARVSDQALQKKYRHNKAVVLKNKKLKKQQSQSVVSSHKTTPVQSKEKYRRSTYKQSWQRQWEEER